MLTACLENKSYCRLLHENFCCVYTKLLSVLHLLNTDTDGNWSQTQDLFSVSAVSLTRAFRENSFHLSSSCKTTGESRPPDTLIKWLTHCDLYQISELRTSTDGWCTNRRASFDISHNFWEWKCKNICWCESNWINWTEADCTVIISIRPHNGETWDVNKVVPKIVSNIAALLTHSTMRRYFYIWKLFCHLRTSDWNQSHRENRKLCFCYLITQLFTAEVNDEV